MGANGAAIRWGRRNAGNARDGRDREWKYGEYARIAWATCWKRKENWQSSTQRKTETESQKWKRAINRGHLLVRRWARYVGPIMGRDTSADVHEGGRAEARPYRSYFYAYI